jgi:hypothetical protein
MPPVKPVGNDGGLKRGRPGGLEDERRRGARAALME